MDASMRDLRYKTKEIVGALQGGENVTLTKNGKIIGKIMPIEKTNPSFDDTGVFGIFSKRKDMKDVDGYVRRLRNLR